MAEKAKTKRNIVFVHPDLGIGGAERLVIDAAVGLQNAGHKVTILTSYRDTNHCFEEARDGKSHPPSPTPRPHPLHSTPPHHPRAKGIPKAEVANQNLLEH